MLSDKRFQAWKQVQAYKHDGHLHRQWSPAFLVEETDDYWALASRMSSVVEADGRRWMTKEAAIFLLYKKEWMNVIAMFKETGGICYYVNIASPTILDNDVLKYVDYDLDVKLYPDLVEKTLDEKEYAHNAKFYGYDDRLMAVIERAKKKVIDLIDHHQFPFIDSEIERLYQSFLDQNKPILDRRERG